MSLCRIELFGGLKVRVGVKLVTKFRTRKTASLLAYLACHLDKIHLRDKLVDMFWWEADLEKGRNSLSKAISSLRQQLTFVQNGFTVDPFYSDKFHVGLKSDTVVTDLVEFDAHLKSAYQAKSSAEKIHCLTEAVRLYTGELLPELDDEWVEVERVKWSEKFLLAVQDLVRLNENEGDLRRALHYAYLLLENEPFSETACEQVLRLLLALQKPTEALREYEDFQKRLKKHFGDKVHVSSPRLLSLVQKAKSRISKTNGELDELSPTGIFRAGKGEQSLPPVSGIVTFLAIRWERTLDGDAVVKGLCKIAARYGGKVLKTKGNALFVLFPSARKALECAVECQLCLRNLTIPNLCILDTMDLTDSEFSRVLDYLEQLLTTADGCDQILCTEITGMLVRNGSGMPFKLANCKTCPIFNGAKFTKLFQVKVPNAFESERLLCS